MKLEIKGFIPNTFIDWEGKVASIVFLPKCNFKCPYCYAVDLVLHPEKLSTIPFEQISSFLKEKSKWIDGLIICGGEPSIYPELSGLISNFKAIPIAIKLDTNGANPKMLKSLIKDRLIDYVAMDLKAPLSRVRSSEFGVRRFKYDVVAGIKVDLEKIKESIDILMKGDIDYEFRTTVCPAYLKKEDIVDMARAIAGAKRYVLQQFRPGECLDPKLNKIRPYPVEHLSEMAELARRYVSNAYVRGGD